MVFLGVALILPWCADAWYGADVPLNSGSTPLIQIYRMTLLDGPGILLYFGVPYLLVLGLFVVAFVAASRGHLRAALVSASASASGAVNFVLFLSAAHEGTVTTLTATPLAATVLLGLPAVVLLTREFRTASANDAPTPLRDWSGLVWGLLILLAVFLAAMAYAVIFPAPSVGLSDRRNPALTVFFLWIGGLAYQAVALAVLAWATRRRVRPVWRMVAPQGPRAPP